MDAEQSATGPLARVVADHRCGGRIAHHAADAVDAGEVPVRRIPMGVHPDKAANRAALINPAALDYFIDYAKNQRDFPRSDEMTGRGAS